MVQWLGLCTSDAGTWVPPLVRDLGSHVLCDGAKKKSTKPLIWGKVGFKMGEARW